MPPDDPYRQAAADRDRDQDRERGTGWPQHAEHGLFAAETSRQQGGGVHGSSRSPGLARGFPSRRVNHEGKHISAEPSLIRVGQPGTCG